MTKVQISAVEGARLRKAFVELPFKLYADSEHWVPPLRSEVNALLSPKRNPWFEHGKAQFFVATRDGTPVGRISAHIDYLALGQPSAQGLGPGTGFWGLLESDSSETTHALLDAAERWLRENGSSRSVGPFSLSYWDEVGLLVEGFDAPPTVMMGYNTQDYADWVVSHGYAPVQDTHTYEVPLHQGFPELCNKIVAAGERNTRIRIRQVDRTRFAQETAIIVGLINDAWSGNWGFVPFTDAEVAYAARKLKPLVFEPLIRIAEVDGDPVAFMMVLPDVNERIRSFNGNLLPFNWAKLLLWLRRPKVDRVRVPLMGVASQFHGTRLASQLSLMLIEYIRRDAVITLGAKTGEFGWVLKSNGPMLSVSKVVGGVINKTYRIFEKDLTKTENLSSRDGPDFHVKTQRQ